MFKLKPLATIIIVLSLIIFWAEYQNSRPPEGLASVLNEEDVTSLSGTLPPDSEAGRALESATEQLSPKTPRQVGPIHTRSRLIRKFSPFSHRQRLRNQQDQSWNVTLRNVPGGLRVRIPDESAFTVTVYDGIGNALKSKVVVKGGEATLPTDGLLDGVYFVTVASEKNVAVRRMALNP